MAKSKHIVVIGAGISGLAAASILAAAGSKVTLFERNATPGGKMQELKLNGYRFDTGPGLLTLPELIENLFKRCGENWKDYLSVVEPDPLGRYFYPDGTIFDNHHNRIKTTANIKEFAPEDSLAYGKFLDYSEKLYERTSAAFLLNPLYQWSDLKAQNLLDALKIDAFQTVSQKVDTVFKSEYLRKFFKRFATYSGSSPFQAPATLNVIPHVEISKGGFYVKGGMYKIAQSLENLAIKKGVIIRYSTDVKKIEVSGHKVTGIQLQSGKHVTCDIVISNSDAYETILKLIDKKWISASKRKKQEKLEPSCSGLVLFLGVRKRWEKLRHHNIFFSSDYKQEFRQIFKDKILPVDPTIYIANTSFTDPDHAPAGSSNLFVLVNAPSLPANQDWKVAKKTYPDIIINKLQQYGLDNLRGSIETQAVLAPPDFYTKYRSNRGSIYGTSSNSRLAAFMRPRNKIKEIKGLYMAGGSTHPGGGIPLVILSAMHAVTLIERYETL